MIDVYDASFSTVLYPGQLEFVILSRKAAETCRQSCPYILISITDVDKSLLKESVDPNRCDLLRVQFNDVTSAQFFTVGLLSEDQADSIINFVLKYYDAGVRRIVIHCEMGISRSASVGKAISEVINGESSQFDNKYSLNTMVYDLVYQRFKKKWD